MTVETKTQSRLTVVEQIYHQGDDQPMAIEVGFSRVLASDESPYLRPRFNIGEQWQPLDKGWVSKIGMVVIRNHAGEGLLVNPTDAQRAATAQAVIEISLDDDLPRAVMTVSPGEAVRFQPTDGTTVKIRYRKGSAKCSYVIFPG